MFVTEIEISNYAYNPETAQHSANVRMALKNRFINLFCRLDGSNDTDTPCRTHAFVREAMRQIRRMPEFRNGHAQLDLSDDLRVRETPLLLTA